MRLCITEILCYLSQGHKSSPRLASRISLSLILENLGTSAPYTPVSPHPTTKLNHIQLTNQTRSFKSPRSPPKNKPKKNANQNRSQHQNPPNPHHRLRNRTPFLHTPESASLSAGVELADARVELHESLSRRIEGSAGWESGEGVVVDSFCGAMMVERQEGGRGGRGFEVCRAGVDFGGLGWERVVAGRGGLRRWWEVPGRARAEGAVLC